VQVGCPHLLFCVLRKKWIIKDAPSDSLVKELSAALNIDSTLSSLLIQRGISSFKEAKTYFRPSLDQLHDPFLMDQMDVAVKRIHKAISKDQKILVYGDYDVDGTTSVALMHSFLSTQSDYVDYYLPDRYEEGYGISEQSIDFAAENGYSLIIALDCGIRANSCVEKANKNNIDFIICDHHLPGEILPPALAILDPKKETCGYPFDELSGCGIGFKLIQGYGLKHGVPEGEIYKYLDLVAVSTCADIVPIVGENRILTYFGLRKLNQRPLPGLDALIKIAGRNGNLSVSDVVFGIAPRINAAGRMNHAKDAVQLLLMKDGEDLGEQASILNKMNAERKLMDEQITEQAIQQMEEHPNFKSAKSAVLYNESWHKGVIGIVASRVIEKYYRPTIILTKSKGKATGSARSVKGFNVYEAISACSEHLDQFGGHKYAAGLTMPIDNIKDFANQFEDEVRKRISPDSLKPMLSIDQKISLTKITMDFYKIIRQMEPFGPGNPAPLFIAEKVMCKNARIVGENHLKLSLTQEGSASIDAIAFRMSTHLDAVLNNPFNIAFHIELNEYQGNQNLQLVIKDIQLSDVA